MNRRKPFIVEFTGSPEAGKTTIVKILHDQLLQMGYKVKVYPESAEKCPVFFPKECLEAKLWINFDTAKHILEAPFLYDYDIILFDRGALDRLFWLYLDSVYKPEIVSKTVAFEEVLKNYPPNLLVGLHVSEKESIRRRGGEGRLVTKDFVTCYNRLFKTFINSLDVKKIIISTDNKSIEEVSKIANNFILESMSSHS